MSITVPEEPFPIHSRFPTANAKHFEGQEPQVWFFFFFFACGNSHLNSRRELKNKKMFICKIQVAMFL